MGIQSLIIDKCLTFTEIFLLWTECKQKQSQSSFLCFISLWCCCLNLLSFAGLARNTIRRKIYSTHWNSRARRYILTLDVSETTDILYNVRLVSQCKSCQTFCFYRSVSFYQSSWRKLIYKSEEKLSGSFRIMFSKPWEPKIVIGQPVYQRSTIRVNTMVSSGIRLAFIRRHRSFICSLKQIFLQNMHKYNRNLHGMRKLMLPVEATKLSADPKFSEFKPLKALAWLVTQ